MKLHIVAWPAMCGIAEFKINGIDAAVWDFVDYYDHDPHMAHEYGCGNMRADPIPPKDRVLEKYKISIDEYHEICDTLCEKLHIGECAMCAS